MKKVWPLLLIALVLAGLLSPFASSLPDGLEWAAQKLGFDHYAAETPIVASPLPDYTVPALGDSPLSTAIAGIAGTLICFLLPFTLYLFRKK